MVKTSLIVALFLSQAVSVSAQVVTAAYNIDTPDAGAVSLNYGVFGYTDESGEFIPLTGNRIIESRMTVNFRPGTVDDGSGNLAPYNIDHLHVSMLVPVEPDDSSVVPLFEIEGADLTEISPGTYAIEIVTQEFNGVIRPGRFSVDIESFDPVTGDPTPLAGEFFGGSGWQYSVAVPEPVAMLPLTAIALLRRRR